ncbi:MAG: hypothetical protein IRZ02_00145 [Acidothermus sp.]|nr:hypothetical protein [Acidothermus sp.]MCL6537409.1 hypothetical protein [Acidothermus sp.]
MAPGPRTPTARLDGAYQAATQLARVRPADGTRRPSSLRLLALTASAYAITTVLLGVAAVFVLTRPITPVLSWIAAVAIAALALRTAPWPPSRRQLRLAEPAVAPRLFAALAELCKHTGLPDVDQVAVVFDDLIDLRTFGWANRRVLILGLPRWAASTPEERGCILVHHLAHGWSPRQPGWPPDPRGNRWIRCAQAGIARWCHAMRPLTPQEVARPRRGAGPGPRRSTFTLTVTNALVTLPYRLTCRWREALEAEIVCCAQAADHAADALTARLLGAERTARWLRSYRWRDDLRRWLRRQAERDVEPDLAELSVLAQRWRAAAEGDGASADRADELHAATVLRLDAVGVSGGASASEEKPDLEQILAALDAWTIEELRAAYRGGISRRAVRLPR